MTESGFSGELHKALDRYSEAIGNCDARRDDAQHPINDPLESEIATAASDVAGLLRDKADNSDTTIPKNGVDHRYTLADYVLITGLDEYDRDDLLSIARLLELQREHRDSSDMNEPALEAGLLYGILGQRRDMRRCMQYVAFCSGIDRMEVFRKVVDPTLTYPAAASDGIKYDTTVCIMNCEGVDLVSRICKALNFAGIQEVTAQHFRQVVWKLQELAANDDTVLFEDSDQANFGDIIEQFFEEVHTKSKPISPIELQILFDRMYEERRLDRDCTTGDLTMIIQNMRSIETGPIDSDEVLLVEEFLRDSFGIIPENENRL